MLYPLRVHPKPAAGCVAPTSSDAYLSALNGEKGTATGPPPHVFAFDVNITASDSDLLPATPGEGHEKGTWLTSLLAKSLPFTPPVRIAFMFVLHGRDMLMVC